MNEPNVPLAFTDAERRFLDGLEGYIEVAEDNGGEDRRGGADVKWLNELWFKLHTDTTQWFDHAEASQLHYVLTDMAESYSDDPDWISAKDKLDYALLVLTSERFVRHATEMAQKYINAAREAEDDRTFYAGGLRERFADFIEYYKNAINDR